MMVLESSQVQVRFRRDLISSLLLCFFPGPKPQDFLLQFSLVLMPFQPTRNQANFFEAIWISSWTMKYPQNNLSLSSLKVVVRYRFIQNHAGMQGHIARDIEPGVRIEVFGFFDFFGSAVIRHRHIFQMDLMALSLPQVRERAYVSSIDDRKQAERIDKIASEIAASSSAPEW